MLVLACVFAIPVSEAGSISGLDGWVRLAVYLVACLLIVKVADILLSRTKGLAIAVILLSIANACGLVLAASALAQPIASVCVSPPPTQLGTILSATCSNPEFATAIVATGVLALTACLYYQELYRGIGDVGFVGATFRAERKRHYGI